LTFLQLYKEIQKKDLSQVKKKKKKHTMKTTQQYSKEENKIILKPFALSSESLHD
jgi:hypothetical protein